MGPLGRKGNKKLKFITEEKRISRKNKTIVSCFIAFIVLLGTVSTLFFLKEYDYDLSNVFEKKEETTEQEGITLPVNKEGNATILFAGSSTQKDELYFIALINFDMKEMQASVCCLPKNAVADGQTLKQSFVSGGADKLVKSTSKYSGADIDRYIVVSEKDFKTVVRYLGNFTLELDEKITYNGADYSLNLVKGKQTLTGDKLMHYIRYQEKIGGAYLNAQARIICDMIDQMVSESNNDKGEELFNKFINVVDSNITIIDYTHNVGNLNAYIESDERQPSVNVELSFFK